MAIDVLTLKERYIDSCERHNVPPNTSFLSGLRKAEVKKVRCELCSLDIFLHQLKDIDFPPLLDICMELDNSEIKAVDVCNGSSCTLKGEYALKLMRAINRKLRIVDLQDSFGKSSLRDLSQKGLPCQMLVLMASNFRKLNMVGPFMHICTLNLDFSTSLTSFQEDCFACMPNLMRLSMCQTRISNLWTTTAALSKLPSLVDLRFQNWVCCGDTEPYFTSSSVKSNKKTNFSKPNRNHYFGGLSVNVREFFDRNSSFRDMLSLRHSVVNNEVQSMSEDSSDDSEAEFCNREQEYDNIEPLSNALPEWHGQIDLLNEFSLDAVQNQNEDNSTIGAFTKHDADVALKYISYHPSPICFEKHYREYMIASLPHLKVLDNLSIRKSDKERATLTYSEHFEHLPYRRKNKECVVSILQKRETKAGYRAGQKSSYPVGKSQNSYTKSFCAAKVGSSAWPLLHPLTTSGAQVGDERKSFRPRQFEYHPSFSSLMAFGTLDGEVVVVNHESEKIISYVPSLGAMNSVLGLCWLKKNPFKLLAGSDNGSLKMYDVQQMPPTMTGIYNRVGAVSFDEFDQLTSVHVNSTDELFLASGYSRNVALYDISSGRRLQVFTDMHQEHINVVKFANHSPSIFATSSFDHDVKMWDLRQKPIRACYTATSSKGNVMVCFSPDDYYLLVSAVDNEVTFTHYIALWVSMVYVSLFSTYTKSLR
ncbi:WD repeat containing protein [Parasponia andersonii]|uniref:WD repeat containing protein n=1 Tax=Parasponia andersonii TaxID=3476 RepID=A0A2P5DN98_PARAD|nr:WD repeat containing protein [Parasponia andersonii]